MRLVWLLVLLTGCVSFPIDLAPMKAKFCHEQPLHAVCGVKRTENIGVESLEHVRRVNRVINSNMTYKAEFADNGLNDIGNGITLPNADVWQSGTPTGDCEDYALTKYQMLHDAGYAPDLLLLYKNAARFIDRWGHAVAVVEIDGERWVLDNETDTIRRKSRAERVGAIEL